MKIMHMADLHLGSFPGPDVDGENARFKDLQAGLVVLTAQAKAQMPDLIVIAGDLFHQAKVWSDRGLREQAVMVRFLRNMMDVAPVFVLRGTPNHDSYEQFRTLQTTFLGEERIVFGMENGVYDIKVHGQTVYLAALPGFHRDLFLGEPDDGETDGVFYTTCVNEAVRQLDAVCPKDGAARILVGHYTIQGSQMESGQNAFFANTEPVVFPMTLDKTGFDLCCFGHIHRPQQIPGCAKAFYSGALSRLNFNDEGQPRGFYMHTVDAGHLVQSVFNEVSCREFLTIRLDDDQIGRLIEDKYNVAVGVDVVNKIVRVKYSCTDAHNKALSTAVIEKQLYNAGAFYVQEIVPVEIKTTVGVSVAGSDKTSVENLESYLSGKDMPDEDKTRLVQMALPLVQDVQSIVSTRRISGLFEPVEISVHNYRNYENASFQYDWVRFCTINGENGVGKSSLFMDAVVDALYEMPREGDLTGWIRNDPSVKSGQIMFTFRLGKEEFRVIRFRRKSGATTLKLEQMQKGSWVDVSKDKVRDTQDLIVDILGMDALTFKSCVFIMQDQYGLFLSADPSQRMEILGNLFGLGVYDTLETSASEKLTGVNRQIRDLNARMDQLAQSLPDEKELQHNYDDVAQRLDSYSVQQDNCTARIKDLQAQVTLAMAAKDRVVRLNQEQTADANQRSDWLMQHKEKSGALFDVQAKLACQNDIVAGKNQYDVFVGQERELAVQMAEVDGLQKQVTQAASDLQEKHKAVADCVAEIEQRFKPLLRQLDDVLAKESVLLEAVHQDEELEKQWNALYVKQQDNQRVMNELHKQQQVYMQECSVREAQLQGLSIQIQSAQKQVSLLENCGCVDPEHASCQFLKDAQTAKAALPGLLEKFRKDTQALNDWKKQQEANFAASVPVSVDEDMRQIVVKRNALKASVDAYHGLAAKRAEHTQVKIQLQDRESKLDGLRSAEQSARDRLSVLQDKLASYSSVKDSYRQVQARLAEYKHWDDDFRGLPGLSADEKALKARIAELEQMISNLDVSMEARSREIAHEQASVRGLLKLQNELQDMQKISDDLALKVRLDSELKGQLGRDLDALHMHQGEIVAFRKEIARQAQIASDYKALRQAFSTDGIRHEIVANLLPQFEAAASGILSQMSGGQMRIEFVTKYEQKSNKGKEVPTLDIIIDDITTGRLPYKSRSGGERVKAALSVILALAEIKSRSAGVQLGFLGIDEPPYLDAQGAQAYCDALEAIQQRYSDMKIMAITHDLSMRSRFPQSVDVVKTAKGSMVIRH